MIKKLVTLPLVLSIGLALMGVAILDSGITNRSPIDVRMTAENTVSPELLPTTTPVILDEAATPTERVLPRVGGNASLVLGASVLVLIIIGGVIFTSRKRLKH